MLRSTFSILPTLLFFAVLASPSGAQGKTQRFPRAGRAPLIAPVVLDFQTEDDFVTPLVNGRSVSSPQEFGALVSISGAGLNLGPAIFDSTPGGPNDPSQDLDLLVGRGNVLILQNSQSSAQTTPDIFDRPNDDQDGGQLIFDFDLPAQPLGVVLVDIDSGSSQASSVTLQDDQGRTRLYTVPPRWTRDLVMNGPPGLGTLDLTTLAPQPGYLSTATATEQVGFDAERVVRLVVALGSSGAVDDLSWSPGRSIGMVADSVNASVVVFDADLDVVLGTVALSTQTLVGDCAIDPSRRLGFATDFGRRVWVIDLAASPPALAAGINPILVSNLGEDLSLSPNRKFLAVSDGGALDPLSIVDLSTRLEVGTVSTGEDCNSIDFCSDDSLAGTSFHLDRVVGFSLANDGTPALTGAVLPFSLPNNVVCAPGDLVGVAISRFPARLTSFRTNDLTAISTRFLDGFGLSACFSTNGQRLFVRKLDSVEARSFDPMTGSIGALPLYSFPADALQTYFGMDRIALHPDGSRLYVAVPGGVRIHDPQNGALLSTLPMPVLLDPGGIAIARGL